MSAKGNSDAVVLPFLQGGGEMGQLIRLTNWSKTPLGTPDAWPVALKQTVSMMLTSSFPILICWGADYTQLYNDKFRPINGETKHPQAMGGSARDTYAEIWETIGPMFAGVMNGETFGFPDFMVPLNRNGYVEDCYFDFSYSPIRNELGEIGGVLVICIETTAKVIALRKLEEGNLELSAANEESAAANEELAVANGELLEVQNLLQQSLARLTESEDRFRTMAESSDIMIGVGDDTSNAIYFNKAWTSLTGRSMQDLLQFGWVDLVHPDDKDRYVNIYLDAFKVQGPFTGEFRVLNKNGSYRWLLATGTPRFRTDGSFAGYISSCFDITERTQQYEERQALLNSVKGSERKLEQIINQMPAHVLVLRGPELIIETVNEAVLTFWKKNKKIIGKPLLTVLPELVGQPFPEQLRRVLATGKTITITEGLVELLEEDGTIRNSFVDYSYQAIKGVDGKPEAILVMSFEVTDKVASRKLLEKYAAELQDINDEAAAANEELGAANEELTVTNEELAHTQAVLEKMIGELADSEANFRSLILQSPVAMGLFKGMDMTLEVINNMFLELWGKDNEVIGKTLLQALPELTDQPYLGIMQDVYRSGQTYYGTESEVYLYRNGKLDKGYYDFINHPFLADDGTISGIIVVAIEVTEQVRARNQLRQAEEMLRMAIDAAGIGTWHIEPQTKALKYNPMLAKLFGYDGDEPMTYEQAIAQVGEEHRPKILKQIEQAIASGEDYDIVYTHKRFNDGEIIWLRSLGKITPDDNGNYTIFSGVVMDITEQKKDDLRKNDFIGMVSHELKTPLTTLTALVQVANAKLKNNPDPFLAGAMEKANIQVKKMGGMINGFLNISRLESGKILIDKQTFNLEDLIVEIIKETELTVSSHRIIFERHTPVNVHADHDKIGSVIANLVSNAVKYSPKGKFIEIKCEVKGNAAQVSVRDEGMGIKPQDQERLFDRYYRVEANHMQHISGFGIGLYLSAEIIYRHDGEIWVESEVGVGSVFYFSLPVEQD